MDNFKLHTIASAPEKSQATLQALTAKFGFLPNVMATMADNPVLLNGFAGAFGSFHGGSLDECEKQILLLTNAVAFACPWTIAAHSTFALEDGVSAADVQAIRAGRLPQHPQYAALSALSRALIAAKGIVTTDAVDAFTAAGYAQSQVFEVVIGIGLSTIAATATNLAQTPIEERFQAQRWTGAEGANLA